MSAYWDAAGSGRFLTRWSAVVSLPIATLLLVPVVDGQTAGYAKGVLAAAISWVVLAVPMVAVAGAERRMHDHRARALLITATLVIVAFARPALNDTVVSMLFDGRSTGAWASRAGTNLIVAFGVFALVAVITTQYQHTRATTDRLSLALGRLDAANRRLSFDERDARLLVRGIVAELRTERDAMLAGPVDFDAVRDFSERVRAASHRLEQLAAASPPVPGVWSPRPSSVRHKRGLKRLQPTPLLSVGVLYLLMCLPFLWTVADLAGVIAAGVSVLLVDLAAGAVLRALPVASDRARGASFLVVWALAGAAVSTAGHLLLPSTGAVATLPLVAIPFTAIVVAIAIDIRRRARDEEERSTGELAHAAADFADHAQRAQAPLRHAASTLHGRVQGRCVIFAAYVDESVPTDAELAQFGVEVDRALDEVTAPASAAEIDASEALHRMLAGWEPLMALETRIDDDARVALESPGAASVATEVVNEALVNAVKHSGARAARIDITSDAAGEVHVRVASAGSLPRAIMPMRSFAGPTLLYQDGPDVVLESTVPVPRLAAHA